MSANNKEENIKNNQKSEEDSNLEEAKSPDKNKEDIKEKTVEEKLKDTEEKLLRSLAEIENQRRRFEKEIKEAFEFDINDLPVSFGLLILSSVGEIFLYFFEIK